MDKYEEVLVFAESIGALYGFEDGYVRNRYEHIKEDAVSAILEKMAAAKIENHPFCDFVTDSALHGDFEQSLLLYLLFDVLTIDNISSDVKYNREAFVYRLD